MQAIKRAWSIHFIYVLFWRSALSIVKLATSPSILGLTHTNYWNRYYTRNIHFYGGAGVVWISVTGGKPGKHRMDMIL